MTDSISLLSAFHLVIAFIAIISMVITTFRLAKGPAILDRSIALDVLVSGAIALTAVIMVSLKREDLGVLLVIFALTSFISGVVIARFSRKVDAVHKPVLSDEEARQQVAEREREAEDAELVELTDAQVLAAEQRQAEQSTSRDVTHRHDKVVPGSQIGVDEQVSMDDGERHSGKDYPVSPTQEERE